jgi:hypothetical protein
MTTGWKVLREAIIKKINDELKELTDKEKKITEALWSPAEIVDMPAAVVLPEELESSYQNTMGGRRLVFIFRVFIMEELKGRKQEEVEKELSDAIDFLLPLFNKKNALTVDKLLHIQPTPSVWGYVTYGGGEARIATMTLRCEVIIEET